MDNGNESISKKDPNSGLVPPPCVPRPNTNVYSDKMETYTALSFCEMIHPLSYPWKHPNFTNVLGDKRFELFKGEVCMNCVKVIREEFFNRVLEQR